VQKVTRASSSKACSSVLHCDPTLPVALLASSLPWSLQVVKYCPAIDEIRVGEV
jgi:hypothetical protein